MGKRIIRIFPRKTSCTPDDYLAIIARKPGLLDQADEIHISVTWTYDIPLAEKLYKKWKQVGEVFIGGPAYGDPGGYFTPGLYVKKGYVMTSRGCPNSCWFCSVWRREGKSIRELPITEGYNLLDSNILACSDQHITNVFAMLMEGKKKFKKAIEFTGGLESARLKQWHVDELQKLKPKQLFFAYDTPDDLEPLIVAGKMLTSAGFTISGHSLRCYVLCGYNGDSIEKAEIRMNQTIDAGFMPMAMLYRDEKGVRDINWIKWQRQWSRPIFISQKIKERGV